MKKRGISLIVLIVIILVIISLVGVLVFSLAGKSKVNLENGENNSTKTENKVDTNSNENVFTLTVEGKEFRLPITLKDYDKLGLSYKFTDEARKLFLETPNKYFTSHGTYSYEKEGSSWPYKSISFGVNTLDNLENGLDNVIINAVFVDERSELDIGFNFRGKKIDFGMTLEEAIKLLGNDYEVVAAMNPDDINLNLGLIVIEYYKDRQSLRLKAQDGVINYIQFIKHIDAEN